MLAGARAQQLKEFCFPPYPPLKIFRFQITLALGGAQAHRCASDTSKTFAEKRLREPAASPVKTFRCDQCLAVSYSVEWKISFYGRMEI